MIIKSTRNSVVAALAFSVLSGLSSIGNATLGAVEVKSVPVSYADLNLTGSEGQSSLYQRLKVAAGQVCGEAEGRDLQQVRAQRKCTEEALDEAVEKVGSEGLTAIHQG
jgi:UrcA family protein